MNIKPEAVTDLSLDEVVEELVKIRAHKAETESLEFSLSRAVVKMLEERGAKVVRTPSGMVRVKRGLSFDPSVLARLREITDPEDLEGIYAPAHDEVKRVPEKWNMVKGKKLLHYGTEHRQIIEDAKIFGSARVIIEKEEEEGGRQ